MRKREIASNKQFLLFSQCFLPYMAFIFHFELTFKCSMQFLSIWTSLKFCRLVQVLKGGCLGKINFLEERRKVSTIRKMGLVRGEIDICH